MGQNNTAVIDSKIADNTLDHELKFPRPGEIHIWFAELDRTDHQLGELLSQDEIERAERFIFEDDRLRYITLHGILRMLLERYLGTDPAGISFDYSNNGKPELKDDQGSSGLRFNLSHTDDKGIIAFSRGNDIGIDIEKVRDIAYLEQIFKRFFSSKEFGIFQTLPEDERKEAFFNCWTRKEAFIKATGDGLSRSLSSFSVSITPKEPARLLEINESAEEVSNWSMYDIPVTSGYIAALALKGNYSKICYRNWADSF